jgi:hypothetical protein
MRLALARSDSDCSPGPDGEHARVVGEDHPLIPDLLALVAV